MPEKEDFFQAYNLIQSSKQILLASHESPDGDAVGSVLAFYNWLENLKPGSVSIYLKDEPPKHMEFLPFFGKISRQLPDQNLDLLIAFDYAKFSRLGLENWLDRRPDLKILSFDHHLKTQAVGTVYINDEKASSVGELLFDFFQTNGLEFGKETAKCLLYAIASDTGFFRHSNATAKTLRAVKELSLKGVTIGELTKHEEKNKNPIEAMRFWGQSLLRIKIDPVSKMALGFFSEDNLEKYGFDKESWRREFSSIMAAIPEQKLAVFLSQDEKAPEFIKASLRSEYDRGINVSEVAKIFGGGGHKLAAGFRVHGNMEEVIGRLISAARTV